MNQPSFNDEGFSIPHDIKRIKFVTNEEQLKAFTATGRWRVLKRGFAGVTIGTCTVDDRIYLMRAAMRNWAIRWKINKQMRCRVEAADCLKRAIEWRDASMCLLPLPADETKPQFSFVTVCMYCKKEKSREPRENYTKDIISHGLCAPLCDGAKSAGWAKYVTKANGGEL